MGRYGSAALKPLNHACTLSATTALSRSCFLATSMSTIAHFPCSRSQRQPWRGRPLGGAANWTEHWPLKRTQAHTISTALGLGGVCGATVMLGCFARRCHSEELAAATAQRSSSCACRRLCQLLPRLCAAAMPAKLMRADGVVQVRARGQQRGRWRGCGLWGR